MARKSIDHCFVSASLISPALAQHGLCVLTCGKPDVKMRAPPSVLCIAPARKNKLKIKKLRGCKKSYSKTFPRMFPLC